MKQVLIKNRNNTFSVDLELLLKILEKYRIKVFDVKKIKYGWKNVCFIVKTINNKSLFVKCFDLEKAINNEIQIYKMIKNHIDVPKLFFAIRTNGFNILVYEYIVDSIPLFEYEKDKNNRDIEIIFKNIASTLAKIHNIFANENKTLNVPDFNKWYKIFLKKNNVIKQLGYKRKNQIESIDEKFKKFYPIIEKYKSFTHCDFKSNNILIKNNLTPLIIDWEFSSYCYSFLDIGQLFREKIVFENPKLLSIFNAHYNNLAINKLPENWDYYIKLVDMGNLLEMLSRKNDLEQNKKVLKIIDNYLEFLESQKI